MASRAQRNQKTRELDTGQHLDTKSRSIQEMGGNGSCLGINLSETGVTILSVDKQDQQQLLIFEKGIWIPRK
jgi:hypothetical protein